MALEGLVIGWGLREPNGVKMLKKYGIGSFLSLPQGLRDLRKNSQHSSATLLNNLSIF
jgi:hypothetical protein